MTASLARRHGADQLAVPRVASAPRSLEEMAHENAREGCVREMYGALVGTWQAEVAADARVRRAMRTVAADETRHAELAWQVHAWIMAQLDDEAAARVEATFRQAVGELTAEVEVPPAPELVTELGVPSVAAGRALLRTLYGAYWAQA